MNQTILYIIGAIFLAGVVLRICFALFFPHRFAEGARKVLFLDEPTMGLDPDGALRLIELVRSLNRDRNITVLLSSHNLYQVQKICHRVGIMIKGKMVAEGSIEALAEEKFGVGDEKYTLEEIYMKYFQEV